MFPVAGRPLIQYAVQEAADSGLDVVLVLRAGKCMIHEYFEEAADCDKLLSGRDDSNLLLDLRQLAQRASIQVVYQDFPRGLADAVACARPLVGNDPFAVILPDALIDAAVPCTRQLISCYDRYPGCVLATQTVAFSEVSRFGIVETVPMEGPVLGDHLLRVVDLKEHPNPGETPSRFGIFGRYILQPEIFDAISRISPGVNGELQLTDALRLCAKDRQVYAYKFEGSHYDAGSPVGFVQATLAFAMKDPETAGSLRDYFARSILAPGPGL